MDHLDHLLADYFLQSVPANNTAFRREVDLFLALHKLDPKTKFGDLPRFAQSEICRKATVDLRSPNN